VGGVAAPARWQATGTRRGRYKKGAGRGGSHDEDDDDISTCSGMSRRSERHNRERCFNCGARPHRQVLSREGRKDVDGGRRASSVAVMAECVMSCLRGDC
jgi:hypothetical protein